MSEDILNSFVDQLNGVQAEPEQIVEPIAQEEKQEIVATEKPVAKKEEESEPEIPVSTKETKKGRKGFSFNKDKYEGRTKEELLEALEHQEKRVHEKDQTIGRQGQKHGDRVKELQGLLDQNSLESERLRSKKISDEDYNELHEDNPAEARRRASEMDRAQYRRDDLEQQNNYLTNQLHVMKNIPNFQELKQDISSLVLEDLGESQSDAFNRDPFSFSPAALINLAKRAEFKNETKSEIASLKQQLQEIQVASKENQNKTVDSLKKTMESPHGLAMASGSSAPVSGEISVDRANYNAIFK